MKLIDLNVLCEESFIDYSIISSDVNINNKKIVIKTRGAQLDDKEGTILFKAKIIIEDWYSLHVVQRNGASKILDSLPDKFLSSILEFHYNGVELKLIDVGYNCWLDWVFLKPKLSVYGSTKKEVLDKFLLNCIELDEIPSLVSTDYTLDDFQIKNKPVFLKKVKDHYGVDLEEVHFRSFKLPLWRILNWLERNNKSP